jgi:hypothetical protein
MTKRWWFTEYTKQEPTRWTWRLLRVDGSIEQQSAEFASYGAAVRDAIINGFRPTQDHWVIESTHAVVHYEHGQHSVVVAKLGEKSRLVPPRQASRRKASAPLKKQSSEKQGR